jgi:hypothetical protein
MPNRRDRALVVEQILELFHLGDTFAICAGHAVGHDAGDVIDIMSILGGQE